MCRVHSGPQRIQQQVHSVLIRERWSRDLVVFLSCGYVVVTHFTSRRSGSLTSVFLYFIQTAMLICGPASSFASVAWLTVFGFHPEDSSGGSFGCLGPISAIDKFTLSLAMPFVFLGELVLGMVLHIGISGLHVGGRIGDLLRLDLSNYSRNFIALLLYSFTSLTTTTVNFLDCTTIGSRRVVTSSPAIDCDSKEYERRLPLFIVVLCLALLVPVLCTVALLIHRKSFATAKATEHVERFRSWSILFEAYKPSAYFWHVVILLRRLAYVLCTTIHDPRSRGLAFNFIAAGCILMQHAATPYLDATSNRLEIVSLTLHCFLAALMTAFPDPASVSGGEAGVLLLVTVPCVLFLGYLVLIKVRPFVMRILNINMTEMSMSTREGASLNSNA